MVYENHLGVIVVFLEFPRVGSSEIPDKFIIIARISHEELEFRQLFFGFENRSKSVISNILRLDDDGCFG